MAERRQTDLDWHPSARVELLQLRADLLTGIRGYFARYPAMEVDTPALSAAAATDPAMHSFVTTWCGPGSGTGRDYYLHTSPEFPMKRLLAAGSGDIYQLCKVFRDTERGRLHSPEFTLLEWYRVGYDHLDLMDEVERLLREILSGIMPLDEVQHWTYRDLFREVAGLDPFACSTRDVAAALQRARLEPPRGLAAAPLDDWLDLALTHLIEPRMGKGLLMVRDFPASQAALARLRAGNPPVAARFEAWLDGIEIANGFHELSDASEQHQRFAADNRARQQAGLADVPVDTHLLAALEHGLPDCAGVALGIDRLLMVAVGADRLDDVMAFPIERA